MKKNRRMKKMNIRIKQVAFEDLLKSGFLKSGDKCHVESGIIKTTSEGMEISVFQDDAIGIISILPKNKIEGQIEEGEWFIKNTSRLLKVISGMSDVLNIKKEDNKLLITDGNNSELEYPMSSREFINNDFKGTQFEPSSIPYEKEHDIMVDSKMFNKAANNTKLLNSETTTLKLEKTVLKFISSDGTDILKEKLQVNSQIEAESKYGKYLLTVNGCLNGFVQLNFQSKFPLKIVSKSDNITATYYITPVQFQLTTMIIELTFARLTIALTIAIIFFGLGLAAGITISLFLTSYPDWKKRLELIKFIIRHKKDIEEMMDDDKA